MKTVTFHLIFSSAWHSSSSVWAEETDFFPLLSSHTERLEITPRGSKLCPYIFIFKGDILSDSEPTQVPGLWLRAPCRGAQEVLRLCPSPNLPKCTLSPPPAPALSTVPQPAVTGDSPAFPPFQAWHYRGTALTPVRRQQGFERREKRTIQRDTKTIRTSASHCSWETRGWYLQSHTYNQQVAEMKLEAGFLIPSPPPASLHYLPP